MNSEDQYLTLNRGLKPRSNSQSVYAANRQRTNSSLPVNAPLAPVQGSGSNRDDIEEISILGALVMLLACRRSVVLRPTHLRRLRRPLSWRLRRLRLLWRRRLNRRLLN